MTGILWLVQEPQVSPLNLHVFLEFVRTIEGGLLGVRHQQRELGEQAGRGSWGTAERVLVTWNLQRE